jgi:hypothetical protein
MKVASSGVSPATGASAQTRMRSGREFDRHGLRDRMHRALGAVVPGEAGTGAKARGRAHIHDHAPALRAHLRDRGAGEEIDRLHVDREDAVELVLLDLEHRPVAVADPALLTSTSRPPKAWTVSCTARFTSAAFETSAAIAMAPGMPSGHFPRGIAVHVHHGHASALAGKGLDDPKPEALGPAGHQGPLALQTLSSRA